MLQSSLIIRFGASAQLGTNSIRKDMVKADDGAVEDRVEVGNLNRIKLSNCPKLGDNGVLDIPRVVGAGRSRHSWRE